VVPRALLETQKEETSFSPAWNRTKISSLSRL